MKPPSSRPCDTRPGHLSPLVVFGLGVVAAFGAQPQESATGLRQRPSLTFVYEQPGSSELQILYEMLRESRLLESWTDYVNRILTPLPTSIEATMAECGKANSWYDPGRQRIIFCYEEAERSLVTLRSVGYDDATNMLTAWIGSILHQLYHELGHALVDMLSLPVLGNVEDGADRFAAIVLLGHPEGEELLLGVADYFQELSAVEAAAGLNPAQRHLYYSQRYYIVLCLTYGSNPEKHGHLVTKGRLPKSRSETCRHEYIRAAHGWGTLLESFGR